MYGPPTVDFEAIRRESISVLEDMDLEDPVPLPLLTDASVAWLRPVDQIVERCHGLAGIVALAQGGDPDDIRWAFEESSLRETLNGRERLYFDRRTGVHEADEDRVRQAEIDAMGRKIAMMMQAGGDYFDVESQGLLDGLRAALAEIE